MTNDIWILAANHMMARALEVDRWVEIFAHHGVTIVPHLACDLRVVASERGLKMTDASGVDVAPPRLCICRVYERQLPAALELMGTTCLVSSRMVDLCYDKTLVSQLVAAAGVPMVQSLVVPEFSCDLAQDCEKDFCGIPYPVVLKPASGRGGHGVCLAHNKGELLYHLDRLVGMPGLAQPLVDPERDLRVYVIGNEVRYAMERIGAPGDFRSNYSTGGTARRHELTERETRLATRVLAALPEPLPFGSVDFCFKDGEPVFCEVNANLGCHIPYEFAQLDLIGDYADWIRTAYAEECS